MRTALANVASGQWTQLWSFSSDSLVQQPERRAAHAMVAFRDALYIYGGIGDDSSGSGSDKEFDDTWKFDLLAREWTQIVGVDSGVKPPRRFHHSGVLHSNDTVDELVVFGGLSFSSNDTAMLSTATDQLPILQFNDVWRLKLSGGAQTIEWTKDSMPNSSTGVVSPTPRSEAGAVIYNDQMLVFGGIAYDTNVENTPADNNELWSYNLSSCVWTQLTPVGTARPAKRFSHSVALVKEADGTAHLVAFSGRRLELSSWTLLSDMWVYTIAQNQWIPVSSTSPLARAYTSMVSLSPTWTWFFGGYYKPSQGPNGYVYDDVVAAKLALTRLGGSGDGAVINPDPSRLTPQTHSVPNAVVAASVKMYLGVPNPQQASPLLRYNHRAATWRGCMVIHGGSYQTQRGDVWVFNASSATVREETAAAMPMDVETLVYVLGGFIVSIVAILMILLVRWRRIDRQHVRVSFGGLLCRLNSDSVGLTMCVGTLAGGGVVFVARDGASPRRRGGRGTRRVPSPPRAARDHQVHAASERERRRAVDHRRDLPNLLGACVYLRRSYSPRAWYTRDGTVLTLY